MIPLPTHFIEGRFTYTQLERQGMVALFTQVFTKSGAIRYEVIKVQSIDDHLWPAGNVTLAHEYYPGVSLWGKSGWTFLSLPAAKKFFATLVYKDTLAHRENE